MFGYTDKLDRKTNKTHRNYFLTQGDSFTLSAGIDAENMDLVQKIVFKIGKQVSECQIDQFYEQDYGLVDGVYLCMVESETTNTWSPTDCPDNAGEPYVYEIEVHYLDGGIETIEQAQFTIYPQNVKKSEV